MIPLLLLVASYAATDQQAAATASVPSDGTLKVFLLAGQSNMEGYGVADLDDEVDFNGGRGTLVSLLEEPAHQSAFGHWAPEGGSWPDRDDVFVSYQPEHGPMKCGPLSVGFAGQPGRHHFGPELEIGRVLGDAFDEPVLLIKTCWGGKSLMTDFRPPSANGDVGPCYTQMIEHYHAAIDSIATTFPHLAAATPELTGFFWFQGWNDMYEDGALDAYAENLVHLVTDLRAACSAPDLPVVVGQTGNAENPRLWSAQEAATRRPNLAGHSRYVATRSFLRPADESPNRTHAHHWFGNAESYLLIGRAMGEAMVVLTDHNTDNPQSAP